MPYFQYTALTPDGKRIKGTVQANSESQAADLIRRRNYIVLKLQPAASKRDFVLFGVHLNELVVFCRQLATMVSAGVRLKDALSILSRQDVFSSRFRRIITNLVLSLEMGMSFSEALRNEKVFDSVFINLVSSGEEGGILDKALEKASDFYESSKKLQDEVKSAMAYPTFVLFFAIGVIFLITFYILPKLISVFGSIPTSGIVSFLMNANRFLSQHWLSVLITLVLGIIGIVIFLRTRYVSYVKEWLATLFPPLARLRNMMAVERFCRILGTLIGSGVLLTKAVEMAAAASNSPRLIKLSKRISERVREGASLRQAMLESGVFPQLVYEMVGTGEETGKLEEVLLKVADFYEDQIRTGVKRLVSLIEPMLIAGVGGFIAFMALTMYSTIFQLQQTIGR
ncbi:type II secretion system protein F [Thermotoga sp. Ku-13t]|uniref:type II secretion system F family protein n=1 Tax=Thermotoga sp. Ku-13t TaxID=1755813 RepID=UPI0013EA9C5F|nr:type II secretion system F family protein [Thermotoga sp. Ku-13t]KAF2957489.1 type II secretion system protein F [Thermotoga sp. Ku-13t]